MRIYSDKKNHATARTGGFMNYCNGKTSVVSTFLLLVMLFTSSCATILNGKYQKMDLPKIGKTDELLVNGKKAKIKAGKLILQRDLVPKQITYRSKGAKDQNLVIMQHKKSFLHVFSWIPFGILFYPPLYDRGPKSWNYGKDEIKFAKPERLAMRQDDEKFIKINKLGIELDNNNLKWRYFPTYKSFLKRGAKVKAESSNLDEPIKIENTEFSLALNKLLKDKGFIDTSRTALKNSFLKNLLVNATVKDYTINQIANRYLSMNGSMVYIDLSIEWQILDFYESVIYTTTTKVSSGQYAIIEYDKRDKVIQESLRDAVEGSFLKLMADNKVSDLLRDQSDLERERNFTSIGIPLNGRTVSTLPESVQSTVTVKKTESFGSGFVVSPDGYIITNYHVVSDTGTVKVVLNDEREFDAEIIRVSKIYDLALLKIKADGLVPFRIDISRELPVATDVFAVGTPSAEDLSQTVTKGIVSGFRKQGDSELIQTDASINFGNSGGPLVNRDGQVIGVVSSKLSGFGVEGVAFGIPAYNITDKLKVHFY